MTSDLDIWHAGSRLCLGQVHWSRS